MADVTPTTESGKAMVNLKNLFAESGTFQTAIGAEGETDAKIALAKTKIHLTAYKGSGTYSRPFVIIMRNTNEKISGAGLGSFVYGGDLEVRFERDISQAHADDPDNAELDFVNFYETVMTECMAKGLLPGYFVINTYSIIEGPMQYEKEKTPGVFIFGVRLNVNWGVEPS